MTGLSSSLQQLILRILLEDERVQVVVEDKKFYATSKDVVFFNKVLLFLII